MDKQTKQITVGFKAFSECCNEPVYHPRVEKQGGISVVRGKFTCSKCGKECDAYMEVRF